MHAFYRKQQHHPLLSMGAGSVVVRCFYQDRCKVTPLCELTWTSFSYGEIVKIIRLTIIGFTLSHVIPVHFHELTQDYSAIMACWCDRQQLSLRMS